MTNRPWLMIPVHARARRCRARIHRRALTMLEMVMVLTVLAVLAGIAIPLVGNTGVAAQVTSTTTTLRRLQDLLVNRYRNDLRGFNLSTTATQVNTDGLPRPSVDQVSSSGRPITPQLRYLFVNPLTEAPYPNYDPITRLGWNGPYLMASGATLPTTAANTYGLAGDPTVVDGWGHPIVLQWFDTTNPGQFNDFSSGQTLVTGQQAVLVSPGPDGLLTTAHDNVTVVLN